MNILIVLFILYFLVASYGVPPILRHFQNPEIPMSYSDKTRVLRMTVFFGITGILRGLTSIVFDITAMNILLVCASFLLLMLSVQLFYYIWDE